MRDIILPSTRDTRCRYADLPELMECFGPATVFVSHCWGAKFGDLIGAACHGARTDRVVWIDIFAVRQWPGNVADLDFQDGHIEKDELCAMLMEVCLTGGLSTGYEATYDAAAKVLDILDTDGSGSIEPEELITWVSFKILYNKFLKYSRNTCISIVLRLVIWKQICYNTFKQW